MEQNWYVICTRQLQEKKVTELLTKKGFENYCPYTHIEKKYGTQKVVLHRPLFNTYVFVRSTESNIDSVKKLPEIVNMVYWGSKPVILNDEAIQAIQLVTDNYLQIKLEKTAINLHEKMAIVEERVQTQSENRVTVQNKSLSVTIPNLGYKITGERAGPVSRPLQKKASTASILIKRLNPAFLFGF